MAAGKHRAPDQPGDSATRSARAPGQKTARPRHLDPAQQRRKPSYRRDYQVVEIERRSPRSAAPATRPRAPAGPNSKERRARAVAGELRDVAYRQAIASRGGGKPSVAGSAGKGAVAGGATGAALGTAIGGPGLGTGIGAVAGGAIGGAGGAVGGARAKKRWRAERAGPYRKWLVIEFAVCIVIAALSPLTADETEKRAGPWMKRMSAIMALFLILGLISAGGRGAGKFAAGVGGLVAIGLMISQRNLFGRLADIFSNRDGSAIAPIGSGPSPIPSGGP